MHLALICPDLAGHRNPMMTLGAALVRRGHRASFVGLPGSRDAAERAGLGFLPVGDREHSEGILDAERATLGELQGFRAMRFTERMLTNAARVLHRDAPRALRDAQVDGLLVDQVSPAGITVAEILDIPCGVVCNALALHQEPAVPPPVTSWSPRTDAIGRWRNRVGNRLLTLAARPLTAEINRFRREHRLPPIHPTVDARAFGVIQIAQQPRFFDFPRRELPEHFHYTGPWHAPGRDSGVPFPFERLDGRPLVYASLGTLQNRVRELFAVIAAACEGLGVQLVISLGDPNAEPGDPLPGALVVAHAPQLELLRRAHAVVTHAGLNTALESLACGLPMVAIPVTNDQPGVARRLEWLGVAEVVPPRRARPPVLRVALEAILGEPRYRTAARACRHRLRRSPGAEAAAALVERALEERRPLDPARAESILGAASGETPPAPA